MKVKHAKFNPTTHMAEPTGERGPAKTTPKHGKKNRWPYDANAKERRKGATR